MTLGTSRAGGSPGPNMWNSRAQAVVTDGSDIAASRAAILSVQGIFGTTAHTDKSAATRVKKFAGKRDRGVLPNRIFRGGPELAVFDIPGAMQQPVRPAFGQRRPPSIGRQQIGGVPNHTLTDPIRPGRDGMHFKPQPDQRLQGPTPDKAAGPSHQDAFTGHSQANPGRDQR